MSFKSNPCQQISWNDSFANLTKREQRVVERSWAKPFSEVVFPAICEERFSVLYSDRALSRPNTPVNVIVGALMLKHQLGLTDSDLFESICCDVRFQYALHTTQDEEQPISDRTLSRFRERLYNYELQTGVDLLKEEMQSLNETYCKFMKLDKHIKRMDSMMIATRSKSMSRLEIVYTVVSNAVRFLVKNGAEGEIPEEMKHYLEDGDHNDVIYYCKDEDAGSRLEKVLREAERAHELLNRDEWCQSEAFRLLERVLNEQTDVDESGRRTAKAKREISPSSLQNPSDPDATYREKAGEGHKGYVGNIVETIGKEGDSLITDIQYEQNIHSDSAFCAEYLKNREENAPRETLITDGAYNSVSNQELAESKNVQLVCTSLTGKETNPIFKDFEMSEDGAAVLHCPMGHAPEKCTYYPRTGVCRAQFKKCHCENCPHKNECNGKPQRKTYAVHVSTKMVARATYAAKLTTDEYKTLTRKRNAIEGIPSVLRRKYRVDEMPVCGKVRSKMWFTTKIMAYNLSKFLRCVHKTQENYAQMAENA